MCAMCGACGTTLVLVHVVHVVHVLHGRAWTCMEVHESAPGACGARAYDIAVDYLNRIAHFTSEPCFGPPPNLCPNLPLGATDRSTIPSSTTQAIATQQRSIDAGGR
jgi:hypothetical protein